MASVTEFWILFKLKHKEPQWLAVELGEDGFVMVGQIDLGGTLTEKYLSVLQEASDIFFQWPFPSIVPRGSSCAHPLPLCSGP